jgi:membrane peptidoglycan carboxypeptidase
MRTRDRSLLSNATALLICGLLAGVVVAAAAFPAVAMSGLLAKSGADEFDSLPTELTVQQSPQITYVYASDHKTLITTFYDENRRDVPLAEVAPVMKQAMVAAEDTRFYEHHGVDVKGVARAFVANQQSGETAQGASTLTMQYVRQAIEYSATTPQEVVDATSDTPGRKLREMRFALALEKKLTKDQILERYLNIAPFGRGAYGIYAAAQVYFNKQPKDLTLPEAALLAGMVKAPSAFDPTTPDGKPQAVARRTYVLDSMVKMHYISQPQATEASKQDITITGHSTPNTCTGVQNNSWGWFCDYLYRWWLQQPAFGADTYEREERLRSGGYTIYTSLDVTAQASGQKNINAKTKEIKSSDALMLAGVEPGTGHVQVMAVNRTYSNDQSHNGASTDPTRKGQKGNYPNTTVPLLGSPDNSTGGYQFGSTFKVFTMLTALSQGVPLAHTINTVSPYLSQYIVQPGPGTCGDKYCPVNDTPSWMNGPRNMWTGFGRSVNTFFVPLEEQVGAQNVVNTAKALGVTFRGDPKTNGSDAYLANNADGWGAFTLGVSAVSPIEMANAYATVAAEGNYCKPLPVVEIRDFTGNKLDAANPQCNQAVDPDVARGAADAARCPVGDQSQYGACDGATATDVRGIVGKPVIGKTGTTDDDRTAALIASTKQLALVGIIADPDNSTARNYSHAQVNYIVEHTLHDASVGKPTQQFGKPTQHMAYGDQVNVPDVTCQSPTDATTKLKGAGFSATTNATPVASSCPAGTVAKTNPTGKASKGSVVTMYISAGGGQPSGGPGQGNGGPGNGGGGNGGGPLPTCTANPIPGICLPVQRG